jgi:hypothetical protein
MTEEQLTKHKKWCRCKYGNDGDEIYREAYTIALERYKTIEKVNQSLFGFLCRWAAREIRKHEKYEVPFSWLRYENEDQTDEMEYDPEDPEWEREYIAIEEREEVEKLYGKWLLSALLNAAENPKPSKVTTDCTYVEEQMKLFE